MQHMRTAAHQLARDTPRAGQLGLRAVLRPIACSRPRASALLVCRDLLRSRSAADALR